MYRTTSIFALATISTVLVFWASAYADDATGTLSVSGSAVRAEENGSPDIKLRIDENYKVVGKIFPIFLDVSLYEVTVSPEGRKDVTFTVPTTNTEFIDWNAVPGKNTYRACAIINGNDEPVCGKPAVIFMGANGELSTEKAVESLRNSEDGLPSPPPWPKHQRNTTPDMPPPHLSEETGPGDESTGLTGSTITGSGQTNGSKKWYRCDGGTGKGNSCIAIVKNPNGLTSDERAYVQNKFDSIPSDQQKEFYSKLIIRVDNLLSSIESDATQKKSRIFGVLQDIKIMAQDRLDALNAASDMGIIQSVLAQ